MTIRFKLAISTIHHQRTLVQTFHRQFFVRNDAEFSPEYAQKRIETPTKLSEQDDD